MKPPDICLNLKINATFRSKLKFPGNFNLLEFKYENDSINQRIMVTWMETSLRLRLGLGAVWPTRSRGGKPFQIPETHSRNLKKLFLAATTLIEVTTVLTEVNFLKIEISYNEKSFNVSGLRGRSQKGSILIWACETKSKYKDSQTKGWLAG